MIAPNNTYYYYYDDDDDDDDDDDAPFVMKAGHEILQKRHI